MKAHSKIQRIFLALTVLSFIWWMDAAQARILKSTPQEEDLNQEAAPAMDFIVINNGQVINPLITPGTNTSSATPEKASVAQTAPPGPESSTTALPEDLNTQYVRTQKEFKKLWADHQALKTSNETLKMDLEKQNQQLNDMHKQNVSLTQSRDELAAQLKAIESGGRDSKQAQEALVKSAAASREEYESALEKIKKLQWENAGAAKANEDLSRQVKELTERDTALVAQYNENVKAFKAFQSEHSAVFKSYEELTRQAEQLKAKESEWSDQRKKDEADLKQVVSDFNKLKAEHEAALKSNEFLTRQLQDLENKSSQAAAAAQEAIKARDELTKSLAQVQAQNQAALDVLGKEKSAALKSAEDISKQAEGLKARQAESESTFKSAVDQATAALKESTKTNAELSKNLAQVQAQNEAAQKSILTIQAEKETVVKSREELAKQFSNLQVQYGQAMGQLAELNKAKLDKQSVEQEWAGKLKIQETENALLNRTIASLREDLASTKAQLEYIIQKLEAGGGGSVLASEAKLMSSLSAVKETLREQKSVS